MALLLAVQDVAAPIDRRRYIKCFSLKHVIPITSSRLMLKFSRSAAVKKAAARDKQLDRGKEEGSDGSVHLSAVAAS